MAFQFADIDVPSATRRCAGSARSGSNRWAQRGAIGRRRSFR